jgi:hypothetical protein
MFRHSGVLPHPDPLASSIHAVTPGSLSRQVRRWCVCFAWAFGERFQREQGTPAFRPKLTHNEWPDELQRPGKPERHHAARLDGSRCRSQRKADLNVDDSEKRRFHGHRLVERDSLWWVELGNCSPTHPVGSWLCVGRSERDGLRRDFGDASERLRRGEPAVVAAKIDKNRENLFY